MTGRLFRHESIVDITMKSSINANVCTGNSIAKSIEQLLEAKEDLEAWFATEGLEHWRYMPMIYTEKIDIEIDCSECKQFVIVGMNYFQSILNYILMPLTSILRNLDLVSQIHIS